MKKLYFRRSRGELPTKCPLKAGMASTLFFVSARLATAETHFVCGCLFFVCLSLWLDLEVPDPPRQFFGVSVSQLNPEFVHTSRRREPSQILTKEVLSR